MTTPAAKPARVSVVVPTFGRPEMLRQALQSLLAQTFDDFEAIVYDNGADTVTRQVVEGLGDARLTYVARPTNLGMVGNVLDGLRRARGEFVIELDDDDVLHPDFLAAMVAPFDEHPDLALTFCPYEIIGSDGRPRPDATTDLRRTKAWDHLAEGAYRPFTGFVADGSVQLYSALVRRSAVDWQDVPTDVETAFDTHLALAAARDNASAWFVPRTLMGFRVHGAAASLADPLPQMRGALRALELARSSGQHLDTSALGRAISQRQLRLFAELTRTGETHEARRVARDLVAWRSEPRAWTTLAAAWVPGWAVPALRRAKQVRAGRKASPSASSITE